MNQISHKSLLPSKLKYKMLVGFCLMSLLPILAGIYITSLFIKFPIQMDLVTMATTAVTCLLSIFLSFLGFKVTQQTFQPIHDVAATAQKMAEGRLDVDDKAPHAGTDEIQDLARSLRTISHNAKELLEKVEKMSLKDKLTGLYNGVYIRERLQEEIHRSIHTQRPCAFASLQINNYDTYVARHGEPLAEEALKGVAQVLSANLRQFDRAARTGRGEFAVIFPDRNKKKAIEIMEKVAQEVSELLLRSGPGEKLSPSAGLSENPIDGVEADGLYLKAQDRMKAAKKNGKFLEAFE